MNEHEWKKARDPEAMLAAVQDRLSPRKWVLLNCAVARRMMEDGPVGHWNETLERLETGIEHSELVANTNTAGLSHSRMVGVTIRDLDGNEVPLSDFSSRMLNRAQEALHEADLMLGSFEGGLPERTNTPDREWNPLRRSLSEVLYVTAKSKICLEAVGKDGSENERRAVQKQLVLDMNKAMRNYAKPANELLAHFLHEQLGNPYQPYEFDPAWRTSDVMGLAKSIEADRGFDRMTMLADALMEAGCEDEAMLLHLQEEREHQRGCWVLDLILGHDPEVFARPPMEDVSGTGGRHEPLGLAMPRNWDV
jgi:hypothetical protein